jgi:hypothetical protein
MVVYSQDHIKPLSVLCGYNAGVLNVKASGT